MKNQPTVSIIMPAYNSEAYIEESVNSVLAQDYDSWELLIVNDGSTDQTASKIKKYTQQYERIKCFENKINRGLVFSRNRGLNEAKGKYIANLDSDDLALPSRIAKQTQFLEENPDVVLVGSGCELIDSVGKKIGEEKRTIPNSYLNSLLLFSNYFINSSVLFRKSILEKDCLYREGFQPAEDYEFFVQLGKIGSLSNLHQPLVKYRLHESNISTLKKEQQTKAIIKLQNRLLKEIDVQATEEELDLHFHLVDEEAEAENHELKKVEAWLIRLSEANHAHQVYDLEAFDHFCAFFYQRACLKNANQGNPYLTFKKSNLSSLIKQDFSEKLKFAFKSILKK